MDGIDGGGGGDDSDGGVWGGGGAGDDEPLLLLLLFDDEKETDGTFRSCKLTGVVDMEYVRDMVLGVFIDGGAPPPLLPLLPLLLPLPLPLLFELSV